MFTGDNKRFLRLWFEVNNNKSLYSASSIEECIISEKKWFPYNKGGGFRKWYGNYDYVVNYERGGYEIYELASAEGRNCQNYPHEYKFRETITWSDISGNKTVFRLRNKGSLYDLSGMSLFPTSENKYNTIALLNSAVTSYYLKVTSPTLHVQVGDVQILPYKYSESKEVVDNLVNDNIKVSRLDWDSHETSWDFETNPLLAVDEATYIDNIHHEIERHEKKTGEHLCIDPAAPELDSLEWRMEQYKQKWEHLFMQLHENEEELNRQFIDIYGLQDELIPDVPLNEITILQQGEISIENDRIKWHDDVVMKQFVSYAVGCMMGRYSIDKPGLILANQGDGQNEYNEKIPNSRFDVDDDGIIPLMVSDTVFSDNATLRFKQWLAIAFGDTHLVENLNFIEGALGKSLDDYFVKDFWKDHKKMYQNRPIYWLFASKKGAFQCIAYMHRMNAYTAERIRTKYLLPHIEWLIQKQSEMEENAANLSTAERKKLDSIRKQIDECREYHDRLHVVADEQIAFDLDDGVVVNYAKFGDVVQKIK